MNKITRTLAAILVFAAAPVLAADEDVMPVNSDEIADYRHVGEWMVRENRTRGTCFISRSDGSGNLVQMGLTKNADYGYIGIFKKGADVTEDDEMVAIVLNGQFFQVVGHNFISTQLLFRTYGEPGTSCGYRDSGNSSPC